MVWLDGLDIPFVNHLGATFGEDFDGPRYPESRSAGDSNARFGSGLLPMDVDRTLNHSPVFSYPYVRSREILEKLTREGPIDPSHGVRLKFASSEWRFRPADHRRLHSTPAEGFSYQPVSVDRRQSFHCCRRTRHGKNCEGVLSIQEERHFCCAQLGVAFVRSRRGHRRVQLFRPRDPRESRTLARAIRKRLKADLALQKRGLDGRRNRTKRL